MAILMRRGNHADLDPNKLLAGEWAVVLASDPLCTDGKAAYLCFSAGTIKRIATYEDMQELIGEATDEIVRALTEDVTAVIIVANTAITEANTARDYANAVAEDLEARREAGDFTGPAGAPGATVTLTGQFAMQVRDGHLYMIYTDGDTPPNLSIVNGRLIQTM